MQCREHIFTKFIKSNKVDCIWTSVWIYDFKGCDRADLQLVSINGWFQTGSNTDIASTNSPSSNWSYQSWSSNGHLEIPQPDNAEADINGKKESFLRLPTDIYENSIKWHDIACYHPKPFKCKDSDALLDLQPTDEGIRL